MHDDLLEFLSTYVTANKMAIFRDLVEKRTRHITVVLEDLYQPQNTSAVMRTCDCFGVQDVHIIENRNAWETNPDVERGSSKWITLKRFNKRDNNTEDCLNHLRSSGYEIVATSPYGTTLISDLPMDKPFALVFGTEKQGVSESILKQAKHTVKIPMYGFTESFNISVAAAIFLHTCRQKLQSSDIPWQLSADQKTEILISWCKKALKHQDRYVRTFKALKDNKPDLG